MSEKLTFYFSNKSIASQSCLMLMKILNIDIEMESLDSSDDETKLFNKVPVLVNDDLILTESRAIMTYLVDLKCNDNVLYPISLKKRALIDQRLFYDAAVVYPSLIKIIRPALLENKKEVSTKSKDALAAVFRVLEGLLDHTEYFAGDSVTLADISLLPSITTAKELNLNFKPFPRVAEWYEKMKAISGFEENEKNAKLIADILIKHTDGKIFKD